MTSLTSLNRLLDELPISVIERDTTNDIAAFFTKLRDSEFVSGNRKVNLISYSYAKLDSDGRHKWIATDSDSELKRFFFYSLNERYSLIILSVYFELHRKLFGDTGGANDNSAVLLSKLLLQDVGFRLRYDSEITDWQFGFIDSLRAFSIRLPIKRVFRPDLTEDCFRKALFKFVSKVQSIKDLALQNRPDDDDSLFVLTDNPTENLFTAFEPVYECFRPKEELETLRDEIVSGIESWHNCNPGYFSSNNIREILENWVEVFFQVFFISIVFRSWIEYFPAPCGVLFDGRKNVYRNLGGLIVGYKIKDELSMEERSVFRLISSRISAAAAIQQTLQTAKSGGQ